MYQLIQDVEFENCTFKPSEINSQILTFKTLEQCFNYTGFKDLETLKRNCSTTLNGTNVYGGIVSLPDMTFMINCKILKSEIRPGVKIAHVTTCENQHIEEYHVCDTFREIVSPLPDHLSSSR